MTSSTVAATSHERWGYQPSLDGLRAVAVTLVLVFHADLGLVTGGYVGVSVFFTLSGFLITRLLVRERATSGRVDVRAFVARRARRLLPASAVCLIGVAVAARLGAFEGATHLRRDLLGSALQVQNWVLVAAGESYTDLLARGTGRPSPLEHYWSLAIEEQFYWIWPLAFGALAVAFRSRLGVGLAAVTAVAAATAPVVALVWGPDAAYFATPARLAEILLGAWLAVVLSRAPADARGDRGERSHGDGNAPRRPILRAWFAPIGLVAVVGVAVIAPADSALLYGGGFPLFALASTLLVAGLQRPGPVTSLLALPALVAVGRVSYGLYLFHWPVFVAVDEQRTGRDGVVLFALRIAITVVITIASYHLVERPIRTASWRPRPTLIAAGASLVVVAVGATALAPADTSEYWRVRGASDGLVVSGGPTPNVGQRTSEPAVALDRSSPAAPPTQDPDPSPVEPPSTNVPVPGDDRGADRPASPTEPLRVLVVGDSTAEATGAGLLTWAERHPDRATVAVLARPGVGLFRSGTVAADTGDAFERAADEIVDDLLPAAIETFRPDVVVAMVTLRDLEDRVWDPDEGTLSILDPRYTDRLLDAYRSITQRFRDAGARVIWVRPPVMHAFWNAPDDDVRGDSPERARYEQVLRELASSAGHEVTVLDLRDHVERTGLDLDRDARPDGVHWTPEAADELSEDWLGPEILRLASSMIPAP